MNKTYITENGQIKQTVISEIDYGIDIIKFLLLHGNIGCAMYIEDKYNENLINLRNPVEARIDRAYDQVAARIQGAANHVKRAKSGRLIKGTKVEIDLIKIMLMEPYSSIRIIRHEITEELININVPDQMKKKLADEIAKLIGFVKE